MNAGFPSSTVSFSDPEFLNKLFNHNYGESAAELYQRQEWLKNHRVENPSHLLDFSNAGWEPELKGKVNNFNSVIDETIKGAKNPAEEIQKILTANYANEGGEVLELAKTALKQGSNGSSLLQKVTKYASEIYKSSATNQDAQKKLASVLSQIANQTSKQQTSRFLQEIFEKLGGELVFVKNKLPGGSDNYKWVFKSSNLTQETAEQALLLSDSLRSTKGIKQLAERAIKNVYNSEIFDHTVAATRNSLVNSRGRTEISEWFTAKIFRRLEGLSSIPFFGSIGNWFRPSTVQDLSNLDLHKTGFQNSQVIQQVVKDEKNLGKAFKLFKQSITNPQNIAKATKNFMLNWKITGVSTIAALSLNGELKENINKARKGDIGAGANAIWEVGKNLFADWGTTLATAAGGTFLFASGAWAPWMVTAATLASGTLINTGLQAALSGIKNTGTNFVKGFPNGGDNQTQQIAGVPAGMNYGGMGMPSMDLSQSQTASGLSAIDSRLSEAYNSAMGGSF